MKHSKRFILLFFLACTFSSFGQSKIKFGVGLSLIQNHYIQTNNKSSQGIFRFERNNNEFSLGFNVRMSYLIDSDTELHFSPGLRFFSAFNAMDISRHSASFIDLPVQMNVRLKGRWFIIAGLRISYLIKMRRKEDLFFDPLRSSNILPLAISRIFFIPKLGLAASLFNNTVGLEISYNHSYHNQVALDMSVASTSEPTTYKNNFLEISMIYKDISSLFD